MYHRRLTTIVSRTTHIVTFRIGDAASEIASDMGNVPSSAKIKDITVEDGTLSIEFEEEAAVKLNEYMPAVSASGTVFIAGNP